jgi:O-antigen ligase
LKDTNVESAYLATDGWYLKLANETGFFGLISFTFLFLFLLFRLFLAKKNALTFFFFLILTMVFLVNVVSNVLDYFMYNTLFWFLMGAYQNGYGDKPIFSKAMTK